MQRRIRWILIRLVAVAATTGAAVAAGATAAHRRSGQPDAEEVEAVRAVPGTATGS